MTGDDMNENGNDISPVAELVVEAVCLLFFSSFSSNNFVL